MEKKLCAAVCLIAAFILWTALVCIVDVKPVGPQESTVGFATVNVWFHRLTGVHMWLYTATDWLGLVPVAFSMGFAVLGLVQWIRRKSIAKVDFSIRILGGFYLAVMAVYLLFEYVIINRRPLLIEGFLEASYPSSTTLLVLCVMPASILQLSSRIKNITVRKGICRGIWVFTAFMVIGRLISGVHWLTDIIGGVLLSAGLVMLYRGFTT